MKPAASGSVGLNAKRWLRRNLWVVVIGAQVLLALFVLRKVPSLSKDTIQKSKSDIIQTAHSDQITLTALSAGECDDVNPMCKLWSMQGECGDNPVFMLATCPDSCFDCTKPRLDRVPEKVKLRSGEYMPMVGFGTAGLGAGTKDAVQAALRAGYRLIDSAQAREWYREDQVGAAIRSSALPRRDLFITTKVHPRDLGFNATQAAVRRSLSDLHTPYLDLVLLHYAACWPQLCGEGHTPEGGWLDAWRALEAMVAQGLVRSIGVSNFDLPQLVELESAAVVPPSVLQRRSDPLAQDLLARVYARDKGIQYQAYSSLGTQWVMGGARDNPVLTNPVIVDVASRLGVPPALAVLHWALRTGQAVIPRSSSERHMAANLMAAGVEMPGEMVRMIDALDPSYT